MTVTQPIYLHNTVAVANLASARIVSSMDWNQGSSESATPRYFYIYDGMNAVVKQYMAVTTGVWSLVKGPEDVCLPWAHDEN